jgi:F-type H+-transporting ATPase subunit delta
MAGAAAKRYARAIFELAQEQGLVDKWAERLAAVGEVFSSQELRRVLDNPTLGSDRRQEAVTTVLSDQVDGETLNLARLLVESGRVGRVGEIADEYAALADQAADRVRVTATAAVELTEEERARLAEGLRGRLGKQVVLTTAVDPAILGGLVVQTGDQVIDASVATRLQQLRRRLAGV